MKNNKNNIELQRGVFKLLSYIKKTTGLYDFPIIELKKVHLVNCLIPIVPFNALASNTTTSIKATHFFINDYQFERIWDSPQKYVNLLKQCKFVIGTDFSALVGMPYAQQIWNIYRNRLLDNFLLTQGVNVIPSVSWSDDASFAWCFAGIPEHSIVAVSSKGCIKNKESKERFIKGYKKMIKTLKPNLVLITGIIPEELKNNSEIIQFNNQVVLIEEDK